MEALIQSFITVVCAILASSGFWTFWQKKHESKDVKVKLLIGLAHDRIMQSAMYYIDRGYITRDEYENLHDYLYVPYKELGGNGSATHMMAAVDKLEVRSSSIVN